LLILKDALAAVVTLPSWNGKISRRELAQMCDHGARFKLENPVEDIKVVPTSFEILLAVKIVSFIAT
jgi:hypothetical protein